LSPPQRGLQLLESRIVRVSLQSLRHHLDGPREIALRLEAPSLRDAQ
jgi:hypothetical protein